MSQSSTTDVRGALEHEAELRVLDVLTEVVDGRGELVLRKEGASYRISDFHHN